MKLGALTVTKRPHLLTNVVQMMLAQSRRPDLWLVLCHDWGAKPDEETQALIDQLPSQPVFITFPKEALLGEIRNFGFDYLAEMDADIMASFDDDDFYSPLYFQQLMGEVEMFPHGGIWGIQHYWIGWVKGSLQPDGGNIFGKWMGEGGEIVRDNHTTWVVDATMAIRADLWKKEQLRYGEKPKGECDVLHEMARENNITEIAREPSCFCVVRWLPEDGEDDGWGKEHGHTWGPLEYREPGEVPDKDAGEGSGIDEACERLSSALESALFPPRPDLRQLATALIGLTRSGNRAEGQHSPPPVSAYWWVRREAVGKKLLPPYMHCMIQEDTSLPVGVMQLKDNNGGVLRTFQFGKDVTG